MPRRESKAKSDHILDIDAGGGLNSNYLHGDTGEEEEIKFQQADDNLVPSVHCYGGVASDHTEVGTTKAAYSSWQGSRRRCGRRPNCQMIRLWEIATKPKTVSATYPNSANNAFVHHRRLSQEAAMTQGAAINNGRTFAKRVPAPSHSWMNCRQCTRSLCEGIDRQCRSAGFRYNRSRLTMRGPFWFHVSGRQRR